MSNPYAIPESAPPPSMMPPDAPHYSAMVHQVPVFGILMMVHGGIVLLMAFGIALMATMIGFSVVANSGQAVDPSDETALRIMIIGYGILAVVIAATGVVQLWAGWNAFGFRRRTLGFVGIGAAFVGILTCYCSVTGIPLGIWGLVLLLHPDVQYAYEMRKSGASRLEIVNHFSAMIPPPTTQPPIAPPLPTEGPRE